MSKKFNAIQKTLFFSTGLVVGIITGHLPIAEAVVNRIHLSNILLPYPMETINHSCYSIGYDARNKNPSWVYECLTLDNLIGSAKRDRCYFKEDKSIPNIFRSTLQDYKCSGFDRGHLAPAANHKCSLQDTEETFNLSNICPQNQKFNRGYWARLENYVRDLTKEYSAIHVFTGPLYLPKQKANGQRWIKYRVIGKNDVGVPTHFFKILFLEKMSGDTTYQGYVLPNEPISFNVSLDNFKTPIEKIEKAAGIIFQKGNME